MLHSILRSSPILIATVALLGCGGGEPTAADPHAGHDHARGAGHDRAAPAERAAPAAAAAGSAGEMAGMSAVKVDPAGAVRAFDAPPKVGDKALCPVSGEAFIVTADSARSEHEGKHYAYCCPGCKPKFDADPASYLGAPASG